MCLGDHTVPAQMVFLVEEIDAIHPSSFHLKFSVENTPRIHKYDFLHSSLSLGTRMILLSSQQFGPQQNVQTGHDILQLSPYSYC